MTSAAATRLSGRASLPRPLGGGASRTAVVGLVRHDTIEEFNKDSKAECVQLNLAHVARQKYYKEETKTNKRQCPLSSVQVPDT